MKGIKQWHHQDDGLGGPNADPNANPLQKLVFY